MHVKLPRLCNVMSKLDDDEKKYIWPEMYDRLN